MDQSLCYIITWVSGKSDLLRSLMEILTIVSLENKRLLHLDINFGEYSSN
jgi:hypothetical protein